MLLPAQVSLPVGGEQTVALMLDVPSNALAGERDGLLLRVEVLEAPLPVQQVSLNVQVSTVYRPWIGNLDLPACLPPGTSWDISFEMRNDGNAKDTFMLEAYSTMPPISVQLPSECDASLPPGGKSRCTMTVSVATDAVLGEYSLAVCAYSTNDREAYLCALSNLHVDYCRVYLPLIRR